MFFFILSVLAPPLQWRESIQDSWTSINENIYTYNKAVLDLLNLFEKFKHYRLFYIPKRTELPMKPSNFSKVQSNHLEKMKNIFMKE